MTDPILIPHLRITLASHNFSVSRMSPRGREAAMKFAQKFIYWEAAKSQGQWVSVPSRVFASALSDKSVVRFHINALEDFKRLLADAYLNGPLVEWVEQPAYEPACFDFKIKPNWVLHEYQKPRVEYLSKVPPIAKLLDLQTGKGKGLTTMFAMANTGQRTAIILKPKYLEKWLKELIVVFEDIQDKIMVIQGSKELKALLELAKDGLLHDPIILISNATFRNWLSEYEQYGDYTLDMGYACTPANFFEHIKAGMRVVDESHEDFHFCFKLDTYSHVPASIAMTATLITKNPFLQRMYDVMFPPASRMEKMDLDRYADVVNYLYSFKVPEKIRTEEWGQSTYSHTALEDSVMRHVPTLRNYLSLIKSALDHFFMEDRKPGEKALVYAASVKMCTKLTEFLQQTYPQLVVRRFVGTEKDPYENVISSDICVSTIGRAGTAMDIPDLAYVLMTTALDSVQGNIQALGRLRKRDGKMLFMFLTAENIPKHVRYAEAKRELFRDRAKTFRTIPSCWQV